MRNPRFQPKRFLKPVYVLRPQQAMFRLRDRSDVSSVTTPWGSKLWIADDALGRELRKSGVHELALSELMWRLVKPGDKVVDAGANMGYFATLLAVRVGQTGHVAAIEAHPDMATALESNVQRNGATTVDVIAAALSDRAGKVRLAEPDDFRSNTTGSAVVPSGGMEVPSVTLDDIVGDDTVKLIKLDVEGHEFFALQGAARLLHDQRAYHIVFEDHRPLPTDVSRHLEESRYFVFALAARPHKPELVAPWDQSARPRWEAPTYIATVRPVELVQALHPWGWRCLRPGMPV
ncbi:MAG: FkbM family methyltransferase [Actinomycetota bacterium]|nr:FkbM family methyltransferase [Actinomycetota bacterium]